MSTQINLQRAACVANIRTQQARMLWGVNATGQWMLHWRVVLVQHCAKRLHRRCRKIPQVRNIISKLEIWGRAQRKAARRRKSDCRDNFGWFKFRSQQHLLVNQSGKLSEIAPKFHLGGSTCRSITFLFVDQSSQSFFSSNARGVVVDQVFFPFFDM